MERFTGKVKWFNNKTGYGFIETDNEETFVHHTGLTSETPYKYLVQGEYVEYSKSSYGGRTTAESPAGYGKNRMVAVDVTGIKRGHLMCETRAAQRPQVMVEQTKEK